MKCRLKGGHSLQHAASVSDKEEVREGLTARISLCQEEATFYQ